MPLNEAAIVHLEKAKTTLLKKGWTWGVSARNKRGIPVPARDPSAATFCLVGALTHNYSRFGGESYDDYIETFRLCVDTLEKVIEKKEGKAVGVALWNDTRRSVESVTEIIDRAILFLRTEG